MQVNVNYLAVLLASVASMIVGFLWYSPFILGKPWMKLKGYTATSMKEAQKSMGMYYGFSFVTTLIASYVLYHVYTMSLNFFMLDKFSSGLTSGFWMWLGFVMTTQATSTIFGDKNWKLFGIDTGYQLISLLVMGAVIGYMG